MGVNHLISEVLKIWQGKDLELLGHFWAFFAKYLPLVHSRAFLMLLKTDCLQELLDFWDTFSKIFFMLYGPTSHFTNLRGF